MAKMMVRRIGVLSAGKMSGILGLLLGLIIGLIYGLIFMMVGVVGLAGRNGPGAGIGIGLGLGFIILMPIVYGMMSFIFGMIYALIYNLAAGAVGGIELELEDMNAGYGAPPPPMQDWSQGQYNQGQQRPY